MINGQHLESFISAQFKLLLVDMTKVSVDIECAKFALLLTSSYLRSASSPNTIVISSSFSRTLMRSSSAVMRFSRPLAPLFYIITDRLTTDVELDKILKTINTRSDFVVVEHFISHSLRLRYKAVLCMSILIVTFVVYPRDGDAGTTMLATIW